MKFARAIWKLLVGIKDALVLVFMLLFFGLLYAGLSARPAPIGAGVLALDIDGIGAHVHSAQLVDLRTAIYTDPLGLHEGARRYYRSVKP